MKRSDFYYDLPEELIAQHPIEPRNASRLMVIDRKTGKTKHKHFYDLIDLLSPNDCLILNNSRVLPARIYGVKHDTGAVIEFLLLKQAQTDVWEVLSKPAKRAKVGHKFTFGNGELIGEIVCEGEDGNRHIKFEYSGNFYNILEKIGEMPLPHYIKERLTEPERYQTVYSKESGSAAAPTAGLHFTEEMIEKLKEKGVKIGYVTLHVGLGTFRPVKVNNITDHVMHSEHYELPQETADLINQVKQDGGRVIAVGTTSCRTLESVAEKENNIVKSEGFTDIFIYPGYEFKVLDGLITNFHLPESTLIMLVCAFLGYEKTMNSYKQAVLEKYRFFSFGDSTLIF